MRVYVSPATKPPIAYTESRHIPVAIQRWVYARDGGKCISCPSTESLEYDHCPPFKMVLPLRHDPDKIFLKCKSCHRGKKSKTSRDVTAIAKAKRVNLKHTGQKKPKGTIKSRGFQTNITKGLDGKVKPKKNGWKR